jgi:hypothetical protein
LKAYIDSIKNKGKIEIVQLNGIKSPANEPVNSDKP